MRKNISLLSALVVGLSGFVAMPARATESSDAQDVSKLLSEAKTMAFQLKEDAATMESFNRMNVSRESHAEAINQIKDHVNALIRQSAKLRDAKAKAEPWQKQVIDRINPYLDELTGYTEAVIEHLSGEKKHNFAEYQDYLEANADYSADLAAMIANVVDYGKARNRVDQLGAKLEISRSK